MAEVRMSPAQIAMITVLTIIVGYSGWLFKETTKSSLVKSSAKNLSDFFVVNVTATETTTTGSIKDRFMSPKVVHYPNNDTSFYSYPHIISYPTNGKSPWDITALHGKSINGSQKLILWGDVKIHEPSGPQNNDTWLTTSWLAVYPKQNYAETDKPVTFIEPDLTVHSIGMRIYFKEKRVELLNQAQGIYNATAK